MRYLKPRPTTYKGIEMRSRLEAAFAQFLDSRGKSWEYEPRCYADQEGQCLPGFRIGHNAYLEVKPLTADFDQALAAMHRIIATDPHANLSVWARTHEGWRMVRNCSPLNGDGTCDCARRRWTVPT